MAIYALTAKVLKEKQINLLFLYDGLGLLFDIG